MDFDAVHRDAAIEWAENKTLPPEVNETDVPYVRAILAAAAAFQKPMPDLEVSCFPDVERYIITIKGYKQMVNLVTWINTFMGRRRDELMSKVIDAFANPNLTGGCMEFVIHMARTQWSASAPRSPELERRKHIRHRPAPVIRKKKVY